MGCPIHAALLAAAVAIAPAQEKSAPERPSVTVYSNADPLGFDPQAFLRDQRLGLDPAQIRNVPGFGVVKEVRDVALAAGINRIELTDVAQFIEPTTVSVEDLTDPDGTAVLEQRFDFDLVNPAKLLDRYRDRTVTVFEQAGVAGSAVTGRLLSTNAGQLVLDTGTGIRLIGSGGGVLLPQLPEGLRVRPTLAWRLAADQGGTHRLRTSYETKGLTWRADYNLILDADEPKGELAAWVTLLNLCGTGFGQARLKLIAGDVHRVTPYGPSAPSGPMTGSRGPRDADAFEERPFFEYHLYTLPRAIDLPQNSCTQLALFPTVPGVPLERVLVYFGSLDGRHEAYVGSRSDRSLGTKCNTKVDVHVRFRNDEASGLARPLPRGRIRVYQRDEADGSLEFVGEDAIDHTPRDEFVQVIVGESFDVVGERLQTDFSKDSDWVRESFRITLRNHKEEPQHVTVREVLYRWSNWTIEEASDPWTKVDSRTIHFETDVPADGEKTVTYTVKYTW